MNKKEMCVEINIDKLYNQAKITDRYIKKILSTIAISASDLIEADERMLTEGSVLFIGEIQVELIKLLCDYNSKKQSQYLLKSKID